MRAFKSFAREWILPPALYRRIQSLYTKDLSSSILRSELALLQANVKLKDLHIGKPCFVIGNGPSVSKANLAVLANKVIITMNYFNQHPLSSVLRSAIYCACDPATSYQNPGELEDMLSGINADNYVFRTDIYPLLQEIGFLDDHRVFYVKNDGLLEQASNVDIEKVIPWTPDTGVLATLLALYIGCSPIYLLGLDYNRLNYSGRQMHFYDTSTGDDYYATKPYSIQLYWMWRSMTAHEALSAIAKKRGQKIVNISCGSLLDAYERARPEEVL